MIWKEFIENQLYELSYKYKLPYNWFNHMIREYNNIYDCYINEIVSKEFFIEILLVILNNFKNKGKQVITEYKIYNSYEKKIKEIEDYINKT